MIKNRKTSLIICFSVVVAIAVLAIFASTTPTYAFWRFRSALQEHNSDKALKMMDVDAIVEKMVFSLTAGNSAGKYQDKNEQLGHDLANKMLEAMRPVLADTLKNAIILTIKKPSGKNAVSDMGQGSILDYKVEHDGAIAFVSLKKDPSFKFKMAKGPNSGWMIVDFMMPNASKGLKQ